MGYWFVLKRENDRSGGFPEQSGLRIVSHRDRCAPAFIASFVSRAGLFRPLVHHDIGVILAAITARSGPILTVGGFGFSRGIVKPRRPTHRSGTKETGTSRFFRWEMWYAMLYRRHCGYD